LMAMALPIPLEAPVTRAIFPVSNPINTRVFDFAKIRNFYRYLAVGFFEMQKYNPITNDSLYFFEKFLRLALKKRESQN